MTTLLTRPMTKDDLHPASPTVQEATMRALSGRVGVHEVQKFLDQAVSATAAPVIGATASVNIAVWGNLKVDPDNQPWKYDTTIWGGPVYFGTSVGFMYTAYDSWDAFFKNVTSCHAQGVSVDLGILQVNWFIQDGTPVGQFNGPAAGIGLLEAGGSGRWQPK